jgi:hypothetical protein
MGKKRKLKKVEPPVDWIEKTLGNDYMLARWAALFEGVNLIAEHSTDRNKHFDDLDLKPLAIQKFIDYKSDEIMQEIARNKSYEAKR